MGHLGPKGAPKVGPKAAHLRGYINRGEGGRLNPRLFTIHGYCSRDSNAAVNSVHVALQYLPSFEPKP